jgi:hypothetical protein
MSDTVLGGPVGGVWALREIGRRGPRGVICVGEMRKQDIPAREPPLRTHAGRGISRVSWYCESHDVSEMYEVGMEMSMGKSSSKYLPVLCRGE